MEEESKLLNNMVGYTELEETVFKEIYNSFPNEHGRFKILTENDKTKFYVLTTFLILN